MDKYGDMVVVINKNTKQKKVIPRQFAEELIKKKNWEIFNVKKEKGG